jgi:hypothetical protein
MNAGQIVDSVPKCSVVDEACIGMTTKSIDNNASHSMKVTKDANVGGEFLFCIL